MARRGGPLKPHDKPKHPKHPRAIKEGSKTVMIDGSTSIKFLMDNRG
uniref:Uropathogenic specific protein n=1 Tax=Vibrio sp. FF_307 TaxID=1652834 RepID=A0A0H4A420_9VIBR|nr:Uropathogenic specific protein [Vibrio sp. FF_307]